MNSINAPSCVVSSDYEVRIASLRLSDTGRTRPSRSGFNVPTPTGSARRGRSRSTTCSRVTPPRRCDQVKANSGWRMTTTVAAHRAKTGR
jgi:hypothetical protein